MELLGIGEVARRVGLRTSAIRYYEATGLIPRAQRVAGRRRYPRDLVRTLEILRFARGAGFTLDEIRTLFHGFRADVPFHERWEALADEKLRELDARIARTRRMKRAVHAGVACGCAVLSECVLATEDRAGHVETAVDRKSPSAPRKRRNAGSR